jgi:putative glutamine amidotransferase
MKPRIAVTLGPDEHAQGNTRQRYRAAVESAGGEPVLVANVERGEVGRALADFDGLLVPGGPDLDPESYGGRPHPSVNLGHPQRDALELEAIRYAKRSGLPTLAICRGMQVANVALGGTLYEDIVDQYVPENGLRLRHMQTPDFSRQDTTHDVDVMAGSTLAQIAQSSAVATNSLHHQAVRRIAYAFEPVAKARDGIVEALELRGDHPFFIAVQWHPEELVERDAASRRLFERFVEAASRYAAGKARPASR